MTNFFKKEAKFLLIWVLGIPLSAPTMSSVARDALGQKPEERESSGTERESEFERRNAPSTLSANRRGDRSFFVQ